MNLTVIFRQIHEENCGGAREDGRMLKMRESTMLLRRERDHGERSLLREDRLCY